MINHDFIIDCVRLPEKRASYIHSIFSLQVIPLDGNKDDTDSLLVESFLASGRLTHVHWLMGYHPQYLECFLNTHFYLMRAEGPVPFHWRCYIAILAASRHRCCYLVSMASPRTRLAKSIQSFSGQNFQSF